LTLTFELWRDFCTVHLTATFHHPTFNSSEGIVRTNKQTNKQTLINKQTLLRTSTWLWYATPMGNHLAFKHPQLCEKMLEDETSAKKSKAELVDFLSNVRDVKIRLNGCCSFCHCKANN